MKFPGAIRRAARSLRYQTVVEPIGVEVKVTSAEAAPEEVLRTLRDNIPDEAAFVGPDVANRAGTIGKYGLLDLKYEVDERRLLSLSLGTVPLLLELGYVQRFEDEELDDLASEEGLFELDWLSCLDDLAEEAMIEHAYLKIMLATRMELSIEERMKYARTGLPAAFWPLSFTVQDVCITNVASVWLFKHFYL